MTGANEFVRKMMSLKKTVRDEVKEATEHYATEVEIKAIRRAPVSIGQKISKRASDRGFTQTIEVAAGPIGAYIEFGTGSYASDLLANYPKEWRDMAREFYIDGSGTLPSAPYLYPSFKEVTPQYIAELKVILRGGVR